MINTNKQDILNIFLNNNQLINDNDNSISEAVAIIEFNSDSRDFAVVEKLPFDSKGQVLNVVYLDKDNNLHLGTRSIGGTLYNKINNVEEYNNSVSFDTMKIKNVYYPNGTVSNIL